jgi:tetrahydromethanopterin S-methyltransferase subunit G
VGEWMINDIASIELIEQKIYLIRGQKVMLSSDIALLYGVEVRALTQAVRRNIGRFPEDFMFQLSTEENQNLKSQNVISSWGGARRAAPYAFTEQGIAMLSSILNSKRAIQVNIAIMRVFVKLRDMVSMHKEIIKKLDELEKKVGKHDSQIIAIFGAIKQMMIKPNAGKKDYGFKKE